MKYQNQLWYGDVPYPSPEIKNATVKSGGCGCVTSANVAIHYGYTVSIPVLAKAFVEKGIRVTGGTDMSKAAQYLCSTYRLRCTTTNDEDAVMRAVVGGAIAIANVDGNEGGTKGIFSNGGHFINIVGYDGIPPKPFIAFDVGYYDGKFADSYRRKYVSVFTDKFGNTLQYTTREALNIDTANRNPQYWIFTRAT